MWHTKLGDIAQVDKVAFTSPPPAKATNPSAAGAQNLRIINRTQEPGPGRQALTDHAGAWPRSRQFLHGLGHIFRELVGQGYLLIATDQRGSTGYGGAFYRQIDYGGRENDDVRAGREWMLANYPILDPKRVGVVGWSHGGVIALMNIFEHPKAYAAAYAGAPVSDLVSRFGYKSESYRRDFSAPYHIGKDVNVLEVERLIAALKAEGKTFESKIYQAAPGGHAFNRLDTKLAREQRGAIYRFLARYLKPARAPAL